MLEFGGLLYGNTNIPSTYQHQLYDCGCSTKRRRKSTWPQLWLTRVPSLRYSPGQHRQQQHWQGWNQFGMTGVFLSVPRYDWCAHLSHPSSCMLVNHWPSQQSSKEEYTPWKWGVTARYYASHTKTMLPTWKSVPRFSSNWTTRRSPDHRKETQTAVVWSCLPFIRSDQNHFARHSERGRRQSRQRKR